MNKAIAIVLVSLASFTLFAQEQEGFVAKVSTGLDFASFVSTAEFTYHPLNRIGTSIVSGGKYDGYIPGVEESSKKKAVDSKIEVDSYVFNSDEINYQKLKYDIMNPFGYGSSNWYFDRAMASFWLRYFYGGISLDNSIDKNNELPNLLVEQNFFPNGDKQYNNVILLSVIARENISELTIDQINVLPEERKDSNNASGSYIPLDKRTVDENYNLISAEHDGKGFDFLVNTKDIEYAVQILQGKIGNPTLQQKTTEARRQKLISYVRWTYEQPRTIEALRILAFVLKFEGIPDVDPSFVASWARDIAEWRLVNNNTWKEYLRDSMKKHTSKKKAASWSDLYFGAKVNTYSSDGDYVTFTPDAMAKAGFGHNFGNSFVYLTGYFGMPFVGSDLSKARYEVALNTNIQFVNFFGLHLDSYYYDSGHLRGVINPTFTVFNFIDIGAGADFEIIPDLSVGAFGEVFIKKCLGIGIKKNEKETSLMITVQF